MGKLIVPLLVWALTSWGGVASAQRIACRDSDVLRDILVLKHGEVVVHDAVTQNGRILEVYINLNTGRWSLVLSYPNGVSCLVGHGENWRGPFILKEERHVFG